MSKTASYILLTFDIFDPIEVNALVYGTQIWRTPAHLHVSHVECCIDFSEDWMLQSPAKVEGIGRDSWREQSSLRLVLNAL